MFNQGEKKETDSLKAILVGLFLIILIVLITIFKSNSSNSNNISVIKKEVSAPAEVIDLTKIGSTTTDELIKMMQENPHLVIADIRGENQFKLEHIIDSINIPSSNIASFSAIIAKDKPCVLIDATGDVATINAAANYLSNKGYTNISYLKGGFSSWKNKFGPTISDGNQKSFTDQAKVNYIASDSLKKQMEASGSLIIIDLRSSEEFNAGHLAGAINIFLDDLEKRRNEIPTRNSVVIYDNTTPNAFKGAVRLFDLGFSNVLALSGGLDAWKKNGYTVTK